MKVSFFIKSVDGEFSNFYHKEVDTIVQAFQFLADRVSENLPCKIESFQIDDGGEDFIVTTN